MVDFVLEFLLSQTAGSLLATFWMPLLIELPRFFLGGVIVGWCILFRGGGKRSRFQYDGGITIVVSGHNDAASIRRTVLSLREQSLTNLEIIAVNDGSTDDTEDVCRALQRSGLIDVYLSLRTRGGKSAAVNLALSRARHRLFAVTDSDTTFDRNALAEAASFFRDPTVGVVGGTLRVRNESASVVARLQQINYAFSITLGRIVRDMLGFYFVASGAFALYRTEAVRGIGGWDFGPGEDGDIMTRLRLAGWRARFAPFAVALTDVPETLPKLARQRLRWDRSVIRNRLRKSGFHVTDPRRTSFDLAFAISFFDILFFTVAIPFLFVVYLTQLATLYGSFTMNLLTVVSVFYVVLALMKFPFALAVSTRPRRDLRLILYLPLYGLVNAYFLRLVKLYALSNELIFRGSYTDDYVPRKVRLQAKRY